MKEEYSSNDEKNRELSLLKSGKELFESGHGEKAILLFTEILEINSKNIEAYFYLGNIFYMSGQISKGIKAFKKVWANLKKLKRLSN